MHGERHDVAWSQVTPGVYSRHYGVTIVIDQYGSGAAQRFGDQRTLASLTGSVQDRRVKLNKLDVHDLRPGSGGQGETVAGGVEGVRGRGVGLTETPRGEYDGVGRNETNVECRARCRRYPGRDYPANAPPVVGHDIHRYGVVENLDVRIYRRAQEYPMDLDARRVPPGVHDSGVSVTPLEAERIGVEASSEVLQCANGAGGRRDQVANCLGIREARARAKRVLTVRLQRVGGVEHGGEAALGQRRGSCVEPPLAQQHDAPTSRRRRQGTTQARGSRSDDQHVGVKGPFDARRR